MPAPAETVWSANADRATLYPGCAVRGGLLPMPEPWIDLADAIEGLRSALSQAVERGAVEGMHFRLSPVELTLEAVLAREGKGKVGWKILEVGGSRESSSTQTLKLSLTPVWQLPDGTPVEDPLIAAVLTSTENQASPAVTHGRSSSTSGSGAESQNAADEEDDV